MKHCASMVMIVIGLSLVTTTTEAQQRKTNRPSERTTGPALTVLHNPTPSYQDGEVNVIVQGDENPIIRLQMVASGQTLVELPAEDRIFKVNPADPDLVTIEDSPTKATDHYILLRSSRQFLPSTASAPSVATSMIVQMTSGMVVTLLIYPTRDFNCTVHRCVVRYDREAIIKARQAAGLAINLDQREELPVARIPTSLQIASLPKIVSESVPVVLLTAPPSVSPPKSASEEVILQPQRIDVFSGPKQWSKPRHGLQAAVQTHTLNATERQVLVTVRNTLKTPLNIVPGQPELSLQTLDQKGHVLQVETIKPMRVEATNRTRLLAANGTVSYLLTYNTPILLTGQKLFVVVAQCNAADEPLLLEITAPDQPTKEGSK